MFASRAAVVSHFIQIHIVQPQAQLHVQDQDQDQDMKEEDPPEKRLRGRGVTIELIRAEATLLQDEGEDDTDYDYVTDSEDEGSQHVPEEKEDLDQGQLETQKNKVKKAATQDKSGESEFDGKKERKTRQELKTLNLLFQKARSTSVRRVGSGFGSPASCGITSTLSI